MKITRNASQVSKERPCTERKPHQSEMTSGLKTTAKLNMILIC